LFGINPLSLSYDVILFDYVFLFWMAKEECVSELRNQIKINLEKELFK
jgi:hypothetical protein